MASANGVKQCLAPSIRTDRLLLRPYALEDFSKLQDFFRTERSRYVGGPISERHVWHAFMDMIGHWPIFGFGGWAVCLARTDELIGEVSITKPVHYPETELGWLLYDGFEGKGYGLEAARAARHHAFSVCKLTTLVSYINPDNQPSIRLAERLGAIVDLKAANPSGDNCLVYRHTAD